MRNRRESRFLNYADMVDYDDSTKDPDFLRELN